MPPPGSLPPSGPLGEEHLQQHVAALSPTQLQALLMQMKGLVQNQPDTAKQVLYQKPALAYTLLATLWKYALIESRTVEAILMAGIGPGTLHQPARPSQGPAQPQTPAIQTIPPHDMPTLYYTDEQKQAILKKAAALTPEQFEHLAPELKKTILSLRNEK
jgi:hypothetical protein